jgi:NAD(P)H dehydrogenase (quinone)
MSIVSIIYFSGAGHTAKLAESVEKGAASVNGTITNLISIKGEDILNGRYINEGVINMLDESDAIIFGAPTYMSGPAAQFKAFADATVGSWFNQKWKDKLAAGFTISGTPSGDKLATLQFFQAFAMSHSMIWVSLGELPSQPNGVNRLGSWVGAMGQANQEPTDVAPNAEDKLTAERLGTRVSSLATKLYNK